MFVMTMQKNSGSSVNNSHAKILHGGQQRLSDPKVRAFSSSLLLAVNLFSMTNLK